MKKQNEMKINNAFRITFKTILCSVLAIVLDSRKSVFFFFWEDEYIAQGYMVWSVEIYSSVNAYIQDEEDETVKKNQG